METLNGVEVLGRVVESRKQSSFQGGSFEVPRVEFAGRPAVDTSASHRVQFVAASYRPQGLRSYPSPEKQPGSFKKTVGAIGEALSHIPRKLIGGVVYSSGVLIAGLATIFSGMAFVADHHEKLVGGVGAMGLGAVLLAVGSNIWHDGVFKSNKK